MIEINLLPKELRMRRKNEGPPLIVLKGINVSEIPVMLVAISAGAFIAAIQGILFSIMIGQGLEEGKLKTQHALLSVQIKGVEKIKGDIDIISKRAPLIDSTLKRQFSWTKVLNALSDSVTNGIWLTDLSFSEQLVDAGTPVPGAKKPKAGKQAQAAPAGVKVRMGVLKLSGFAYSTDEDLAACVGKFIKSLKENSDFYSLFSNIGVEDIRGDKYDGQETVSFKITCSFTV